MITSGGEFFASEVENLVKGSSYISEVVLYADAREFAPS